MGENEWSDIERTIKDLVNDLRGVLSWTWEDRFGAALAQFSANDKDWILELLKPLFSSLWDAVNLSQAPPRVVKAIQEYGGLRAGQLLLTTDADSKILLLGAWWPWGNQKTISLRLIPTALKLSDSDMEKFQELLKEWLEI